MSASSGLNKAVSKKSVDVRRRLKPTYTHDMTHILRIPLATSISRLQFQRSLLYAKSDPTASNIHPKAFRTPDTQCLTLCSSPLSLKTPMEIQRAKEILEAIKLDDSLYKRVQAETDPSALSPFLVSVKGLLPVSDEILQSCRRLYAPVTVHAGNLPAFAKAVMERFSSAGLVRHDRVNGNPEMQLSTKLIYNSLIRSKKEISAAPWVLSRLPPGYVINKQAAYDLRGFYDKFKDFTWTTEFALERLSIQSVHFYDMFKDSEFIGRGASELASIPLPGIKHLEQESELLGVTYVDRQAILI